ncbi:MAG: hypothetical protein IJ711_07985 [Lachnospiraceae bacterium]|nr:hypothetical protein [Lachnospiraceae bacterium]
MKKLFYAMGILLAIFTIYFSMLYADKKVYVDDSDIYNIMLSKSISGEELEQYAKENDVMIQFLSHRNVSFAATDIENTLINPRGGIRPGRQNSIFPKYNIVYVTDADLSQLIVEDLIIQAEKEDKITAFCRYMKERGYPCEFYYIGNTAFSFKMLFSPLNLKFFSLILILSVLIIAMYYIYRLKEIGILRLNGWSACRISMKILLPMSESTITASAIPAILFLLYILAMDRTFAGIYLAIYLLTIFYLLVVFLIAAGIAAVYIANVNQVNAIKNGRNNRFIFYSLVLVKLITTFLVFSEVCEVRDDVINLNATRRSVQNVTERNLYSVTTPLCSEEDEKKISGVIASLPDTDVFNFDFAEHAYTAAQIHKGIKREKLSEDRGNIARLSGNLISEMKIRDASGNLMGNLNLEKGEVFYLIPQWMQEYRDEIEQLLPVNDENVIYIQDDQTYEHIYWPDIYMYDCVFEVRKPEKALFPELAGEVYLTERAAGVFREEVRKLGLSDYIVKATSPEMDSDLAVSNQELELWETVFYLVMILLSYVITSISVILIYFEFKKKQFGVYALSGRIPVKILAYFAVLIGVIVGVGALMTDAALLLYLPLEWIFYGIMSYRYVQKKAIIVLKGE